MARFVMPIEQVINDDASAVGSGYKLNFYITGTTTRKDTFSDSALTAANANPVVADSAGRFGDIFLEAGTYRVILTDENDVEKWDADNVEGAAGSSGAVRSTSSSETVLISDATKLIDVDASGGAKTITHLAGATAGNGFEVGFRKADSSVNAVTIDGNGAETINGETQRVLRRQGEVEWHRWDGSEWVVTRDFIDPAKWTDIASAATTDLAAADGNYGDITGTATITALGTAPAGTVRTARTVSTPTFTHNATSLILPAAANITASAGDVFEFTSLGSGNWRCTALLPASGVSIGLPRSYLAGLTLSNDAGDTAHDINVTVGEARNADNDGDLLLASEITKQIDATWAPGDDAGGLSSSLTAPANNTWYHVFLIMVAGSVDVGFDTSLTGSNLATDHSATNYRRIGAVRTDGSANILGFLQIGDDFLWTTAKNDLSNGTIANAGTTIALTVPTGVRVQANIAASPGSVVDVINFFPGDMTGFAPAEASQPVAMAGAQDANDTTGQIFVWTDTSAQVKGFSGNSTTADASITTYGWKDRRGKDD